MAGSNPTAEAAYRDGFARLREADLDAAIAAFLRALEADPEHVEALRAVAMARYRKGDFPAAVADGRRLVEKAPADVLAWSSLSLFLMKAGHIQEAEDAAAKSKLLTWKAELAQGKKPAGPPPPGADPVRPPGPANAANPARKTPGGERGDAPPA